MSHNRREFLANVGRGMLVASVGSTLAEDLGLAPPALAADDSERLSFGAMEPLVALMEDTPATQLLAALMTKLKEGAELRQLVAAAALANARKFGGEDYEGYHTFMALAPAYHMSRELPKAEAALPVFKVLYRNTNHIQGLGGHNHEVLHPVVPLALAEGKSGADALIAAARGRDKEKAERTFAALAGGSLDQAYNDLLSIVQDNINVHRVVLAWRAWALLDLTGKEHAHTLLRQSVRFCCDEEQHYRETALRALLPTLLDRYKLVSQTPGEKKPDDAWVDQLGHLVYSSSREKAADAVAAALADGVSHEAVGEALAIAANQLVLHDIGRQRANGNAKPAGSVHGDSVGVHASDAANAWRNIARVSDRRNAAASLIVGAYHTAGQAGHLNPQPYPLAEHLDAVKDVAPKNLLAEAENAIKAKDQVRACALVHQHSALGRSDRAAFDLLLRYAISEDGALHAEKYYRTVTEEYAASRPAFRPRHLAALARVTASEYGYPAPGVDEARRLLRRGA